MVKAERLVVILTEIGVEMIIDRIDLILSHIVEILETVEKVVCAESTIQSQQVVHGAALVSFFTGVIIVIYLESRKTIPPCGVPERAVMLQGHLVVNDYMVLNRGVRSGHINFLPRYLSIPWNQI